MIGEIATHPHFPYTYVHTHPRVSAHTHIDVHRSGPWDSDENIFHLAQLGIKHPANPT